MKRNWIKFGSFKDRTMKENMDIWYVKKKKKTLHIYSVDLCYYPIIPSYLSWIKNLGQEFQSVELSFLGLAGIPSQLVGRM